MDWQAIRETVDAEFVCNHTRRVLVVKLASNGVRHYRLQCQRCGEFSAARKVDYEPSQLATAAPFDETLAKRWNESRWERQAELRMVAVENEKAEWLAAHNEYLASRQWRLKREAVLKRDGYLCRACCARPATQVHHLTYKHYRDEPLFDLVSVCDICHHKITELDRVRYGDE